jgi:ANTAR domain-containing protein/GAF domain-containing protein
MASPLSAPLELLDVYIGLDRELSAAATLTEAESMSAVVVQAVRTVPGAEHASITDRRDGRFRTPASTGVLASTGDRIQYELTSGPCVEVILRGGVVRTGDIAGDPRWPVLGPRMRDEAGVHSLLSFRLFFEKEPERTVGLNLYAAATDAFDDWAETMGTVVATHSALALNVAATRDRAANLQRALASNRRIGMAMGILMAVHKIIDEDAFTLLRIASQNTNRKLLDVADEVIATGALELPSPGTGRSRSGNDASSIPSEPSTDA